MKKFGIALIGCGRIAREHLAAVQANSDIVDLIAVSDIDFPRAESYRAEFGAKRAYSTVQEVLDDCEVDGVLLTLPHNVHHDLTVQCLRAGKHVLVEKIMSNSYADSLDMVKVANECGKTLMVGQTQHFIPGLALAKQMVDDGKIGKLFNITENWNQHLAEVKTNWWSSSEKSGGGFCIPTQGVHSIDMATWFMQDKMPIRVYAQSYKMRSCWEGEDDFSYILTYAGGETVTAHITYDVTDKDSSNYRCFNGEKGSIIAEQWGEKIKLHGNTIFESSSAGGPHMKAQLREFVTAISENREPHNSGRRVAPINALIEAILLSARINQSIEMPSLYPNLNY